MSESVHESEFRVLIKQYFLRKKTITGFTVKFYWLSFTELHCGRTSTCDAKRPDFQKEVITPQIVDEIHEMILNERSMKVRELAGAKGISIERVHHILH